VCEHIGGEKVDLTFEKEPVGGGVDTRGEHTGGVELRFFATRAHFRAWLVAHHAAEERMTPAGLAAFEARDVERSAVYSYEQRHKAKLEPEQEARFRADAAAWTWFEGRSPSWRQRAPG
jgi:hypothetical protein